MKIFSTNDTQPHIFYTVFIAKGTIGLHQVVSVSTIGVVSLLSFDFLVGHTFLEDFPLSAK